MIPKKEDVFWKNLVTGKINHEFNFMVAGLLVKRLNLTMHFDNSEDTLQKCVDEVYDFFEKYEKFLLKDLAIMLGISNIRKVMTLDEVKNQIEKGKVLMLAGDCELLNQLPQGNWIAGTIDSFIDQDGCITTSEKIFVNEIPYCVEEIKIEEYTENNIQNITKDAFDNGFTILIIPFGSKIHTKYGKQAGYFESLYTNPVIGWIAGYTTNNMKVKVYNGNNLQSSSHKAVALHCKLPLEKTAKISIINLFKPNFEYKIKFLQDSFSVDDAIINGKKLNFAAFLKSINYNIQNPIIANYYGTFVNVSFREIGDNIVKFYAPVFKDIEYNLSVPISNYIEEFNSIEQISANPVFSCHCILNYKYSEIEGKKIRNFYGPSTFGEIAYILLNQTVVYLEII